MTKRLQVMVVSGAVLISAAASAQAPPAITNTTNPTDLTNVNIGRVLLGSGQPGGGPPDTEVATQVYDGLYHAPQYLPYFPTAAPIWPRAIEVPCRRVGVDVVCDRYFWRPEYGRAEYLFFVPVSVQAGARPPAGSVPAPESTPQTAPSAPGAPPAAAPTSMLPPSQEHAEAATQ